jgi:hypothetical protein
MTVSGWLMAPFEFIAKKQLGGYHKEGISRVTLH